MLSCPLINLKHEVLFVSLLIELEIVHVRISDWNYKQFVFLALLI